MYIINVNASDCGDNNERFYIRRNKTKPFDALTKDKRKAFRFSTKRDAEMAIYIIQTFFMWGKDLNDAKLEETK